MKIKRKPVFYLLFFSGLILLFILAMQPLSILHFGSEIDILYPQGIVALEQRNLLFIIQIIMLLVVIPVYILTFVFSWKYNAQNPHGEYDPDLVDNKIAEYVWWGLPLVMTIIVAILTVVKTYELDPYRPLVSDVKPLKVQVVALQWKWLFIYPEEKIASLNFLQIPEKTPIHFEITSDAPMNSLWIPSLGGQIYAMPKMRTELHLMADQPGDHMGVSANISGVGFSGMHFITRASTEKDYQNWVKSAKESTESLDFESYEKLAAPSENSPIEIYKLADDNLFNQVIDKYMYPKGNK